MSVFLNMYLILIRFFISPLIPVKDCNIFWLNLVHLFFKLKLLLMASLSLPCACIIWAHIHGAVVFQEITPDTLMYFYVLATKSTLAHLLAPVHYHPEDIRNKEELTTKQTFYFSNKDLWSEVQGCCCMLASCSCSYGSTFVAVSCSS